ARLSVPMRPRFANHLVDIFLVQAARRCDGYLLFFAGAQIFGRHIDDTVRVDIKSHFDLRYTARSRWNSHQVEASQRAVVTSHRPLSLQNMDLDRGLTVCRRRERLTLARRNGGVAFDQSRAHTAESFDTQRERRDGGNA